MKIPPFQLERFFARYEFDAPYLLCVSDCESLSIEQLLAYEPDAKRELNALWLGYTESLGSPELRKEVTRLYEEIEPEQVLIHAGAEEAIFIFMNIALEAGDHLLVHSPCYQSLSEIAMTLGCEVTPWNAKEDEDWELDLDELVKQIRPKTKAIVLNCPHNPTGYLMNCDKQQALVEIARKHGLLLFSDEVYRGLEYDDGDRLPAICDVYERGVSLGVMSKTYGLAGLRIGWIVTQDREMYQSMAAFKDYTTICNSAPSEFLATLALRHKEKLVQRNREIIFNNLHLLQRFFSDYADIFSWNAPKSGPIAFPRLLLDRDVEDFCLELVERKGVLLLPGNYYAFGNSHFRLGFGRRNFREGLERLEEFLLEKNMS